MFATTPIAREFRFFVDTASGRGIVVIGTSGTTRTQIVGGAVSPVLHNQREQPQSTEQLLRPYGPSLVMNRATDYSGCDESRNARYVS